MTSVARMRERCLAGAVLLVLAQAGCCQQSAGVSGTLTLASEFADRGLQLGLREPALEGEVSLPLAGPWSASLAVGVQDEPAREHRVAARVTRYWALSNDWQLDAGLGWYDHRSAQDARHYRYAEAGASVAFRDLLSLGLATRQYAGEGGPLRWALDVGARWPIAHAWSLNGSVGWAQLPVLSTHGYRYTSAGIGWQRQSWSTGLNRIATDATARDWLGDAARSRWSAFIAKDF
jgi:hypothetical protein